MLGRRNSKDFFHQINILVIKNMIAEKMSIVLLVIALMWITESRSSNKLSGAHLTFVVYHNPPYDVLTYGSLGNYSHTGTGPKWQSWLARKLNFTISYVVLNQTVIDKNGGSNVEIGLRLVANKDVDALVNGIIATPERKKMVDFTYFVWTEPYAMVVPLPGEEPRLFALIWPFQPIVWLLIFITTIAIVFTMSLFSKIYSNQLHKSDARNPPTTKILIDYASTYLMYVVNIITTQGGAVLLPQCSFQILVGVWLLLTTVLVNSYSGTVISYLTVPKMKSPIETFEDLTACENVGIVLREDFVIGKQILEAKSGTLKTLGDQARRYPERLFTDQSKINVRLVTGRFAYPHLQTFCKFFVVNQFKSDGACRFHITNPLPFQNGFWSVVLHKDSEFTSTFDKALMTLWESGLPEFWVNSVIPRHQCLAKTKPRRITQTTRRQVPIKLNDLTGAFLILGIGAATATLAFLVEKILDFKRL